MLAYSLFNAPMFDFKNLMLKEKELINNIHTFENSKKIKNQKHAFPQKPN